MVDLRDSKALLLQHGKQDKAGNWRFYLKAKPNSKREGVEFDANSNTLIARIRAPAVDGKANAALIELLAKILDIPKRSITLHRGDTGPIKEFIATF